MGPPGGSTPSRALCWASDHLKSTRHNHRYRMHVFSRRWAISKSSVYGGRTCAFPGLLSGHQHSLPLAPPRAYALPVVLRGPLHALHAPHPPQVASFSLSSLDHLCTSKNCPPLSLPPSTATPRASPRFSPDILIFPPAACPSGPAGQQKAAKHARCSAAIPCSPPRVTPVLLIPTRSCSLLR